MLDRAVIEKAIMVAAELQGHELNGQDRLLIRTKTAMVLAAKQRHRQRMEAPPYQWRKPDKLRR
ncbi:hypothetical protein ACJBF7_11905 [Enterobacter sp. 04-C-01-SI_S15]|nr:hypothetical protein [Enterobacter cloacae]KLQ23409.1 hypothetical protein ABF74_04245 [Enterobacter chengduensis]HBT3502191.1 hypothetical protein [Klebsiella pneumoniae]HCR0840156.1 hypothetical protein [Enterobacter cancerogenus]KZQ04186.1 hypothetical protein A3463_05380 [Enterobacter chengduensis]